MVRPPIGSVVDLLATPERRDLTSRLQQNTTSPGSGRTKGTSGGSVLYPSTGDFTVPDERVTGRVLGRVHHDEPGSSLRTRPSFVPGPGSRPTPSTSVGETSVGPLDVSKDAPEVVPITVSHPSPPPNEVVKGQRPSVPIQTLGQGLTTGDPRREPHPGQTGQEGERI